MTAAEEKIKVIEKVPETEDTYLLREIVSLFNKPSSTDYPGQPMSHEAFLAKIERAQEAARKGDVVDDEQIKKLVATWSNR